MNLRDGTSQPETARPIVVCALEFERQALRRRDVGNSCELHCCGPGASNVESWAASIKPESRSVILAGLAGALSPQLKGGVAHSIDRVISEDGRSWTASAQQSPDSRITVLSASRIVTTTAEKADLFARTGADLVDQESTAFAHAASERGWMWAIIRGVSDDAHTTLPPNLDQWVNCRGQPRLGVVIRSVLVRPSLVPVVVGMRRNSRAAMDAVAVRVRDMLKSG